MEIGEKLICPRCGHNCHTLYQEHAQIASDKADQLNFSLVAKGPSVLSSSPEEKNRMEFSCLYCSKPCHIVVSLSPNGPLTGNKTDLKQEPGDNSQASPEDDVNKELGKKSNFNVDGVAEIENIKLVCDYCHNSCHSLDSNGPDTEQKKETENEVKAWQVFNSDCFVQNLICVSCDNFCHKIYTQPITQDSESAGRDEDNPDLTDAFL